tara:strand:+ start:202 stop:756 length:555 start_codon:yes stop_codon:yes gene_type:complete
MNKSFICIDNFYNDPDEVRRVALNAEYSTEGNYPGIRTKPMMTDSMEQIIKDAINLNQEYNFGKQYCGSFQYTTAFDRSWIHADGTTEWAGVLYLTPNAPPSSGTGFFKFKEGGYTRYTGDKAMDKYIDSCSQDLTKWEKITEVANVYNRLIIYDATQFHMSLDYFGTNINNARLFQTFFFSAV